MGRLAWVGGPAFILITFVLMALRIEPFAGFFYLFAWYGLLFTFDQWIRLRGGYSPIARCGRRFPILLLWSAASWYFFELYNLRLQNWYYIFVVDQPLLRLVGTYLAFATVFPGIFLIDEYLRVRGVGRRWRGKPLCLTHRGRRGMQLLGALFLVLPLLWPTYFFPLVWLAVFLLLAPLEYGTQDSQGLLRQLERGAWGGLLRTLLAGLIAGLLWESLNFWARAKWIYTVPFFERLKLFEMPLGGFLGFPPFAVECVVAYRLLVWYGWAPPFGGIAPPSVRPRSRGSRLLVWAVALIFSLAVDQGVVARQIITSVTPRWSEVASLSSSVRSELARAGVRYITDLEGPLAGSLWKELASRLGPGEYAELERITALYLHQGIGIRDGNLLVRAGVPSLRALAEQHPEALHRRLTALAGPRAPALRRVRLWVRRAQSALQQGQSSGS